MRHYGHWWNIKWQTIVIVRHYGHWWNIKWQTIVFEIFLAGEIQTSTLSVYGEKGWVPLPFKQQEMLCKYWPRLISLSCDYVPKIVFGQLMRAGDNGSNKSNSWRNMLIYCYIFINKSSSFKHVWNTVYSNIGKTVCLRRSKYGVGFTTWFDRNIEHVWQCSGWVPTD